MKNSTEQPWIEAGYEIFSKEGPSGLKVEQLAKAVGISKSSFYHLFADMDQFKEKLLEYHLERARYMSERSKQSKEILPDLLLLLVEMKRELLFNRQLCIHRDNQAYQACSDKAINLVEHTYFDKWTEMLGLKGQPHIARNILKVYTDNFFLRISEENLTYEWLLKLLDEIMVLVRDIKR